MWDWINCRLLGRHQYAVWCQSGNIYLRCLRCGGRSNGWEVTPSVSTLPPAMRPERARRRPDIRLLSRPSAG